MFRKENKNQIKNIIKPNKLLGQHFLRDKNVLDKIIKAANLTKNDFVLEVGPGLGALTRELAKYAGQVIAVEKDKTLAELLTKQLADEKIDNVKIIADDILKINLQTIFSVHPDPATAGEGSEKDYSSLDKLGIQNDNPIRYKVVANIPYYLTSHLIRLLLESPNSPQDIILLIQKEVAQRICACPPKPEGRREAKPLRLRQGFGGQARMSLLAVSVQIYAEPKIIASVSRKSFRPAPKVDSAIIRITPHPVAIRQQAESSTGPRPACHPEPPVGGEGSKKDSSSLDKLGTQNDKIYNEQFFKVVRAGFSHPRKQLLGNLSGGLKIEKEKISAILESAGIKNSQRAETLTVEEWKNLTNLLEL